MFDIFTKNAEPAPVAPTVPVTSVQAPTPTAAEPGNIPPTVDPNAPPATPIAPTVEPVKPVDDSPLAAFSTMWDDVPNKDGEPTPMVKPLDPAKLQEAVAKADFASTVSQENLAAIQAGGDEAAAAHISSMNQVAQTVMNQSLLASNKMIEQAIEQVNKSWEAKLPEILKKQNLNESLVTSNPLFKNPAIKPIMEATQSTLAAKYPNATVAELNTMTQDYIKAMGEAFAPKPVTTTSPEADMDWDRFMAP